MRNSMDRQIIHPMRSQSSIRSLKQEAERRDSISSMQRRRRPPGLKQPGQRLEAQREVSLTMQQREKMARETEFQMHDLETKQINLRPMPTNDPNEPLNWPRWRKVYSMIAVSFSTLFCFTLQCIVVPAWSVMTEELGWTFEELNNSYALSLAAIAVGCILIVPLAIDYGRRPVYLASIAMLIIGSAWSAKMTSVWELYLTQFILGIATSSSEILIQITIADLFFVHERATMNGVYLVFCYLGNNMSQVAGGYITMHQGWRWCYWYCLIFTSVLWVVFFFTFEETKYVIDLDTLADHLDAYAEGSEKSAPQAKPWVDNSIPKKTLLQRYGFVTKTPGKDQALWRNWVGPFFILGTFPVVLFVAVEYGLTVAWTSVMSTVSTQYLGKAPYEWTPAAIGNINISAFVGTVIGTLVGGFLCDYSVVKLAKWNNGRFEPEMRLWSAVLPALAIIASLFMFGYGFDKSLHWSIPVVAYGLASFGGTAMSDSILTYLMDCYRDIIGQSLIGVVFIQNIPPTALVFAIQPWIRAVGLANVFITCGAISIFAFLCLFPMIKWGKRLRHGATAYDTYRASFIEA